MTKPLFIWAGGKTKMIKHYLPFLKKATSYCEPFFGGGAIFVHMKKEFGIEGAYINDIHPEIMDIYRTIKSDVEGFLKILEDMERIYMPLDKEGRKGYYYHLRDQNAWDYQDWDKTKQSAVLYFLMKTSFNGIYQLNKNTNGRYGTPSGLLNQKKEVFSREVVKWWHKNLQDVTITHGNWKENLPEGDIFYFLDPPYRGGFTKYGTGFNDQDLEELLEFAKDKKSMVCNRDLGDGWFDRYSDDFHIHRFPVTYTAGRRKKTPDGYKAKPATEVLLLSELM